MEKGFSEWIASEIRALNAIIFSLYLVFVCVKERDKEETKGRGRQSQESVCNSSLKGQIP